MTFDDDAKLGGGKVSRRGRNVGIGAGVGGIGVIAVVLLSSFLGVDLTPFLGGLGGGGSTESTPVAECKTGADANEKIDCRMEGAAESLDVYWAGQVGDGYTTPQFILFTDATSTGCGNATSAVGPFYCPTDQTIYLDTAFYDELRTRFGAQGGSLAQMYVVAHEWGHHIQNLTGALDASHDGDTGPTSASVRTELQADCYAGAWAAAASETPAGASDTPLLEPVTPDQVADALNAASVIGDDRIQESAGAGVNPETWTHGSSAQRQKWFETGFESGPNSCDTFAVNGSAL